MPDGTLRGNLAAFRASTGRCSTGTRTPTTRCGRSRSSADGSSVFAGGSVPERRRPAGVRPGQDQCDTAPVPLDTPGTRPSATPGPTPASPASKVQDDFVYGTTWHFGPGGNLEGTFKAPIGRRPATWSGSPTATATTTPASCTNGVVYTASHAHYCGNMGGGHPAVLDVALPARPGVDRHRRRRDPQRGPRLPELARRRAGTVDGQLAAGARPWAPSPGRARPAGTSPATATTWSSAASSRGSTASTSRAWSASPAARIAPRGRRDRASPTTRSCRPSCRPRPLGAGQLAGRLRPRRPTAHLPGVPQANNAARYTTTANSNWWTCHRSGFVDTGLTPGQTYSYRIVVNDSDNHVVNGATRHVTMPTARVPTNAYADRCAADGARIYWPLNETSGLTVRDRAAAPRPPGSASTDGRADTGVTWGHAGAIAGDTAARLTATTSWSRIFTPSAPRPRRTRSPPRSGSGRPRPRAAGSSASATCRPATPATATGTST